MHKTPFQRIKKERLLIGSEVSFNLYDNELKKTTEMEFSTVKFSNKTFVLIN